MFRPQIVRTIDKPYKHSKKYKSTMLKNFSRKKVEIEPRIANNHTVNITSLIENVRYSQRNIISTKIKALLRH